MSATRGLWRRDRRARIGESGFGSGIEVKGRKISQERNRLELKGK
jgi:hypothetical protein